MVVWCCSSVICFVLCMFKVDVGKSDEKMENKTQIAGLSSIFLYLPVH